MKPNRERFGAIYLVELNRLIEEGVLPPFRPENKLRMRDRILSGEAMIDGPACKATCKILDIKCTYKAIKEYVNG